MMNFISKSLLIGVAVTGFGIHQEGYAMEELFKSDLYKAVVRRQGQSSQQPQHRVTHHVPSAAAVTPPAKPRPQARPTTSSQRPAQASQIDEHINFKKDQLISQQELIGLNTPEGTRVQMFDGARMAFEPLLSQGKMQELLQLPSGMQGLYSLSVGSKIRLETKSHSMRMEDGRIVHNEQTHEVYSTPQNQYHLFNVFTAANTPVTIVKK